MAKEPLLELACPRCGHSDTVPLRNYGRPMVGETPGTSRWQPPRPGIAGNRRCLQTLTSLAIGRSCIFSHLKTNCRMRPCLSSTRILPFALFTSSMNFSVPIA